jgi:hypothetical protein
MTVAEGKGMKGMETGLISREKNLSSGLGLGSKANVAQR